MQVDPIRHALKALVTTHLQLLYDKLLSNVAFKISLRRYTMKEEMNNITVLGGA